MGSSQEQSALVSDEDERISIDSVTSGIELALITLEYLSADTLHVSADREKEVSARNIARCYRAACHALEVSMLMMEQAETRRKAVWAN